MYKFFFKIFVSTIFFTNFLIAKSESNEKYCKKEINNSLNKLKLEIPKSRQPPIKEIEVIDINNDNRGEILITRDSSYGGGNCCPPEIEIIYFNSRCNPKRDNLNEFDGVWNGWKDVKFENKKDGLILSAINKGEGFGFRKLDVEIVEYLFDGESISLFAKRLKKELEAVAEIRTLNLDIDHPIGKPIQLTYDLNNDERKEIISCNYWDRWGRFSGCVIKSKSSNIMLWIFGKIFLKRKNEINLEISPKRLGVLKQKKNGWNLLVSDHDEKYFFNPVIRNYEKLKVIKN
tara:strand:- start:54 stop:920 length:867 start_codon:yes stop_codon:yes gene_type:complete